MTTPTPQQRLDTIKSEAAALFAELETLANNTPVYTVDVEGPELRTASLRLHQAMQGAVGNLKMNFMSAGILSGGMGGPTPQPM